MIARRRALGAAHTTAANNHTNTPHTHPHPPTHTQQCVGPLCYDFSDADAYLNSASVRAALGVPDDVEWSECNMAVNRQFSGDWMRSFSSKLVPLLEDGVRVLI